MKLSWQMRFFHSLALATNYRQYYADSFSVARQLVR